MSSISVDNPDSPQPTADSAPRVQAGQSPTSSAPAALVAVDVVLLSGSLGEAGLLRRALRDTTRSVVVHEVDSASQAIEIASVGTEAGRSCLILVDSEGVTDVPACLRTLRSDRATAAMPLLVVGSGQTEDQVRASYSAGASSVVQRSHFLDLHLRTLRGVVLYWLDLAEVVPPAARA